MTERETAGAHVTADLRGMRSGGAARVLLAALVWILLACVILVGLAGEDEGSSPTKFLRFVDLGGGEGRLEAAIVTYRGKAGVEVDLVAAVHVADGGYYRGLQKRFETYDALLYEMIKPADAEPAPGEGSDNLLSAFQRGLKNVLGLEFQLDALDYRRKNFVHADLDPDTFFRLQREKGESVLSLLWKAVRKQMELEMSGKGPRSPGLLEILLAFSSEDSACALKMLLARQMEGMELVMAGFEEGKEDSGSVIVSERNKVVLRGLKKALDEGKRRVGVFYGAAHMRDIEKRIFRDLGLEKHRGEWVTAWDMRKRSRAAKGEPEGPGEKGERADPSGERVPSEVREREF